MVELELLADIQAKEAIIEEQMEQIRRQSVQLEEEVARQAEIEKFWKTKLVEQVQVHKFTRGYCIAQNVPDPLYVRTFGHVCDKS